jgi:hypothetical protein
MSKWEGDGYADEQRAALRDLAAKLPPAPCCPGESRLVRDLRAMLDSQARVSEQHRTRVQEIAAENAALAARVRALEEAGEAALRVAERNTTHELVGHGSNLLRMCRICDQVGERDQIDHAPDCPFAALAGSRERAATTTTRTIMLRCHCGRGVTIGADPWCEGCVQSAATCSSGLK